MDSYFSNVNLGPPIEVFSVNKAFLDDTFPQKVNLSIGGNRIELRIITMYKLTSNEYYFLSFVLVSFGTTP